MKLVKIVLTCVVVAGGAYALGALGFIVLAAQLMDEAEAGQHP